VDISKHKRNKNKLKGANMKENLFFASFMTLALIYSSNSFSKAKTKEATPTIESKIEIGESKSKIPFEEGMQQAAEIYLPMQKELAGDSFKSFSKLAKELQELARRLDLSNLKGEHAEHYKGIPGKMGKQSGLLAKSKNIDEARNSFKILSQAFAMWVSMDKPKNLQVVYCPMAKASWVQPAGSVVSNPYLINMPKCGNVLSNKKESHKH
jgi:hypothetical protein